VLPDFPKAKAPVIRQINLRLRRAVNDRPLIAMFKHYHYHEGRGTASFGQEMKDPFRAMAVPTTIKTSDLIAQGLLAVLRTIPDLAQNMGRELEKFMRERIDAYAESGAAGSAVFRLDRFPETFDEYLNGLERTLTHFADDGTPEMPTIVATTPQAIERLNEWGKDPECQRKLQALIARKREEFRARKDNRRLVD